MLIGGRNLTVGKRSLEMLGVPPPEGWAARAAATGTKTAGSGMVGGVEVPTATATAAAAAATTAAAAATAAATGSKSYVFTVNHAFDRSWEAIVEQHGVDWCGFDAVRTGFLQLHEATSRAAVDTSPGSQLSDAIQPGVRMVSMELWDGATGQLVSAEVGYIVGSAYCCLSLFARDAAYPKCSRTRAQCGILWLERAGVELFDAGTTASYYGHLHGFERLTRTKFVEQWRRCRAKPLDSPSVLGSACTDVRGLISRHIHRQVSGGNPPNDSRAAGKRKASELGETSTASATPKGTLSISLADVDKAVDCAALQAHFERHGPVRKVVKLGGNIPTEADVYSAVVIFADSGSAATALAAAVGGTTAITSLVGSKCTVAVTGGPSRKKQRKPTPTI